MNNKKIVHIIMLDKFIPDFIDFVEKHFDFKNHEFYIFGDKKRYPVKRRLNVFFLSENKNKAEAQIIGHAKILKASFSADKIVFHGLFNRFTLYVFFFFPWLLKKGHWVMWGGDFYFPEKQIWFKKQIIRRMGYLVTYIHGDYKLAQKWYGAKGKYKECLMYPSNLFRELKVVEKNEAAVCIMAGNSANPSNNHFEIFDKLSPYKNEDIYIYCPLSYGNEEYALKIAEKGKQLFGDKFIPLLNFMPFEEYLKLLGKIDIAVFAHRRQQGMGNIITLLGLGKKVYMRSDVTPWKLFSGLGIRVFDFGNLNLKYMPNSDKAKNKKLIKNYFTKTQLLKAWRRIFEN